MGPARKRTSLSAPFAMQIRAGRDRGFFFGIAAFGPCSHPSRGAGTEKHR